MGRKRKTENEGLPLYVYLNKGWWVLREYDKFLKKLKGRELRLCQAPATRSAIWEAWEAFAVKITGSFNELSDMYQKSSQFNDLALLTKKSYQACNKEIVNTRITSGGVFGDLLVKRITPVIIRKYMDFRSPTKVSANRERSYLLSVFGWGLERGYCKDNPAAAVKRYKETPRSLYVTDKMYADIYDLALESEPYIRPAMELAYLLRGRTVEIMNLMVSDISEKGICVRRRKGSKTNLVKWSPRLKAAVEAAKASLPKNKKAASMYLLNNTFGRPLTVSGFQTTWQRLMALAEKKGIQRFPFHDLKAKGYSDDKGDKRKGAGHRSLALGRVYDRNIDEVDSVD